jgi:hypothetical protein
MFRRHDDESSIGIGVTLIRVVFLGFIGIIFKFFKVFGKFGPGLFPDEFDFGWSGYGHSVVN